MQLVIQTKYLAPTATRPARIKAWVGSKKESPGYYVTTTHEYGFDTPRNEHVLAANLLVEKIVKTMGNSAEEMMASPWWYLHSEHNKTSLAHICLNDGSYVHAHVETHA